MNYNNRFIYKNRCGIYLINYYKMGKYHISYFVKANLPYYDKLKNREQQLMFYLKPWSNMYRLIEILQSFLQMNI